MEFLFSDDFGELFFVVGTALVLSIVWFGYYRDRFSRPLGWLVVLLFVGYVTAFLSYRYATEHMEGHMASEPSYILLAAIHGTVSLSAIVLSAVMFFFAGNSFRQGMNYFREHPRATLALVVLWPLALLSGFLI